MKLKRSNYILSALDTNNDLLLLNTFNRAFLKVSNEQKDKFLEIIKASEIEYDDSSDVLKQLFETGFLIDNRFDEERKIEDLYIKACHSNNVLSLTILPTEKCNFRCIYCYESFEKGKMDIATQEGVIKFVEKNLKMYNSLEVSWFGGEPLLAIDVMENLSNRFIEICKKQKKPYVSYITTNAYLLTHEVFQKLLYLGVLNYQITLDASKEIHDRQRVLIDGSGTYDQITRNLKDIRDKVTSRLFRITLRTNLLTTAENDVMKQYNEFYKKEFGEDKRFLTQFHRVWTTKENEEIEKNIYSQENFDELLSPIKEDTTALFNEITNGVYPCYASKSNSFVIGSDGQLYKCTVSLDKDYNRIGKIDKNGKAQIDYEKLLFFTTLSSNNRKHCEKCPLLPQCLGAKCPNNQNDTSGCKELIISKMKKMVACSNMAQKVNMEV